MNGPRFFSAQIDHNLFEIDLHDKGHVADALDHMEKQLFFLAQKKVSSCRVIHGIGSGVLARAVHEALEKNPLIVDFQEDERGGICLVLL